MDLSLLDLWMPIVCTEYCTTPIHIQVKQALGGVMAPQGNSISLRMDTCRVGVERERNAV